MYKLLDGYHGTSKENAEKILSTRIYKESGYDEWLGRGVYFFEDDPIQARKFVKAYRNLSDGDIEVLETKLRITENDDIINLLTDEDRHFIEQYEKKIHEQIEMKLPYKNWSHKEGYVLDFLFEKMPFILVKAPYKIPKSRHKKGLGYCPVHIQICVKDSSCIMQDTIKVIEK